MSGSLWYLRLQPRKFCWWSCFCCAIVIANLHHVPQNVGQSKVDLNQFPSPISLSEEQYLTLAFMSIGMIGKMPIPDIESLGIY
jgi:hypothetical protein